MRWYSKVKFTTVPFAECLKVLVLIHSFIPSIFFFLHTYGGFGTRSWVIFRRLYVWSFMHKLSVVWEKSVKNLVLVPIILVPEYPYCTRTRVLTLVPVLVPMHVPKLGTHTCTRTQNWYPYPYLGTHTRTHHWYPWVPEWVHLPVLCYKSPIFIPIQSKWVSELSFSAHAWFFPL